MPDRRRHRGPHQADARLFAEEHHGALRSAVADLSWLLSRGYSDPSALKLVGDRHGLRARQREAVRRCSCSDASRQTRRSHRLPLAAASLASRPVDVDGFNCIVTVEAALSGGLVLVGRDGALRDIASVHGSYRRVDETEEAALRLGSALAGARCPAVTWLLDRPVSNSGRLRSLLVGLAAEHGWPWSVDLEDDPDSVLSRGEQVVATSDGAILDRGVTSLDLAGAVVAATIPDAWRLDLRTECLPRPPEPQR